MSEKEKLLKEISELERTMKSANGYYPDGSFIAPQIIHHSVHEQTLTILAKMANAIGIMGKRLDELESTNGQ